MVTQSPHRQILFTVSGALPPRKTCGSSMWGRQSQVERLVRLREAALVAMAGLRPFQLPVRLVLELHIGARHTRRKGDLDAYVAGVCDGLMAATPITRLAELWSTSTLNAINPYQPLVYLDDFQVVAIQAEKIFDASVVPWYVVGVEEIFIDGSQGSPIARAQK